MEEIEAKALPKAPEVDADTAFAEERDGWKGSVFPAFYRYLERSIVTR